MIRSFGHVGLTVGDLEQSLHFYRDVLGLEVVRTRELDNGMRIAFLSIHGHGEIELLAYPMTLPLPEAARQPEAIGLKHVALRVEDLDETVTQLKEQGIAFATEPTAERRRATLLDPDGITIELTERPPS